MNSLTEAFAEVKPAFAEVNGVGKLERRAEGTTITSDFIEAGGQLRLGVLGAAPSLFPPGGPAEGREALVFSAAYIYLCRGPFNPLLHSSRLI